MAVKLAIDLWDVKGEIRKKKKFRSMDTECQTLSLSLIACQDSRVGQIDRTIPAEVAGWAIATVGEAHPPAIQEDQPVDYVDVAIVVPHRGDASGSVAPHPNLADNRM